ncbi:MAG: LysR family transcriptional regulator [Alphaproteobacteria bacterium]|nr:LysR family transcriptional regulator [Alphaproteobacteria bacterium]MCX8230896.1 LysR family transcriptional regulator [Alphaproteobacteria bacterium]
MDKWTELHTAYLVSTLGTVSAAAETLGVHRATVNRHIDTLEAALGTKLFQRHARGYTPTDAGVDMFEAAGRADEMFADLAGRIRGQADHLSGALIISAIPQVAPFVVPAIAAFLAAHPDMSPKFVADEQLVRLEYGEAHVAIRAGPKPQEPDYVVLPFRSIRFGLYAHEDYAREHGLPRELTEFGNHRFIGTLGEVPKLPFTRWMGTNVRAESIALQSSHTRVVLEGVLNRMGLGFVAEHEAALHESLVAAIAPHGAWSVETWIVTHVDLHRTAKVQEFLRCLTATTGAGLRPQSPAAGEAD